MKKIVFILAMLFCPSLYAATLTANTVPYVCQGGTTPQLCNSNTATDSNGNISGTIPMGGIIEWYGNIASIPPGWTLCNGVSVKRSDGKGMITPPDLRNQFIVGADNDISGVANTSVTGSETQSGPGQIPSTTFNIQTVSVSDSKCGSSGIYAVGDGCSTGAASASFGSGATVVAVYYALAFIMKI